MALGIGNMPASTNVAVTTPLPEGYTNNNTFIVSARILRDNGAIVYTDIAGGAFCSIYMDYKQQINLVATNDGVTYCKNQPVGVLLAKIDY